MKEEDVARWLLASRVRAQTDAPVRILLSIGPDIGAPQDEPLRYEERDAERVAHVLTSLGEVAPDRAYVLTGASADRVRQVIAEIRGRSIELKNVVLITYVSSHADDRVLHLGASELPLQELRDLLASVRARLRLLVLDACTSGTLIRYKGGKAVVPFAIDLERSNPVEGQVVITSAGPSEPAQEWEALGGSLFTHHFLSALRGAADRNADGRVTGAPARCVGRPRAPKKVDTWSGRLISQRRSTSTSNRSAEFAPEPQRLVALATRAQVRNVELSEQVVAPAADPARRLGARDVKVTGVERDEGALRWRSSTRIRLGSCLPGRAAQAEGPNRAWRAHAPRERR